MVANRESIAKVGKTLAELVIEGGGTLPKAMELARKLESLCEKVGTYQKRYDDPAERVLMRHLNLYRNKLAAAKTEPERLRWRAKLIEQEAKVSAFRSVPDQDLDLDGL
ncbi:hypothetical protein [Sphingomonas phage Carli]|nr:hypothetical protein [Sphingomonas phage Carli]